MKEFYNKYSYTHHLDQIINILLYYFVIYLSIHPFLYPPIFHKFQSIGKLQCTLLACFEKDGMVCLLWDCNFLNSKGKPHLLLNGMDQLIFFP